MAVLQFRAGDGKPLPWARMILSDLGVMLSTYPSKLSELGDPSISPGSWLRFMLDYPRQWKLLVRGYHTALNDGERFPDASDATGDTVGTGVRVTPPCFDFKCDDCSVSFSTKKALDQHLRIKHGVRCRIKCLVGDETVCPVCHSCFAVRSKVKALSCREAFLALGRPAPSSELVEKLNSDHRKQLGDAYRTFGRTHVSVSKAACKPRGSVLRGIPTHVLRRVDVHGSRIRCRVKTRGVVADLRFSNVSVKGVRKRISKKTSCSMAPYHSRLVY